MNALRTAEAPTQEPLQSASPLPELLDDPQSAPLIIAAIQRLACTEQSAHWLEQLLEDPRFTVLPGVREEAVRVLLNFGHPYALLITPEDLSWFRALGPRDVRRGWIGASAMSGLVGSGLYSTFLLDPSVFDATFIGAAALWSLSLVLRALPKGALNRAGMIREVAIALGVSLLATEVASPAVGVEVLLAVVPVALTGLAGGWNEKP